jgi:hypothetical protein
MIDRHQLLEDLKPVVRDVEADLRARCDEVTAIDAGLKKEYDEARAADRTGSTYEEWRADLITQVAVAWVLSCVFVRFLEDNALIHPPRISGPLHGAGTDAGLMRARDERETFFKTRGKQTDRDYLLSVFDDLAKLPGTKDVFGAHNPVSAYRDWLSGDAAQRLIEFFQKIDADGTGELVHDFTDPNWDTRFLGDLYQDLSEAARKKYALLQTPIFVEEFILERTLEPAIKEFGLKDFKMIDPACGSGHFLLGSFARILKHWRTKEPGTKDRELVNRAIASVHGVDLNPYAIAIARFRLLLAAMRECHITKLKDAPAFAFNLVCGDSLLHGSPGAEQQLLGFHELAHHYQSEDIDELRRILKPGTYHAVVANPPYITVKDKALNEAYRDRFPGVCHMKYSLSAPFMQRIFVLGCHGAYTGQITANSFMKREFGKKLVESYLPTVDLTHVIDTSGAYIPGHGTPTVILFGRHRKPVASTVRAVMGIKGEPATPSDPSRGEVWTAVSAQIDQVGSQSDFISVNDTPRQQFAKHPWSIGGGGASELKELLDDGATLTLGKIVTSVGFASFSGTTDVFFLPPDALRRAAVSSALIQPVVVGEHVRDWTIETNINGLVPYDKSYEPVPLDPRAPWGRYLWHFRNYLNNVVSFGGKTREQCGDQWWTWYRWQANKYRVPCSIVYADIATHLHAVFDRGTMVFDSTAPVVKLPTTATEDDHFALLGFLNSSTACFWMKQVAHQKQMMGGDGIRISDKCKVPYAFNATLLEKLPLPALWSDGPQRRRLISLAREMHQVADEFSGMSPRAMLATRSDSAAVLLAQWKTQSGATRHLRSRMIVLQEEIDFTVYVMFGLCGDDLLGDVAYAQNVMLEAGERPFCIATQGNPDGFPVPIEVPTTWPASLRVLWQKRVLAVHEKAELRLIEEPHYKRRWIGRQGVFNHNRADDQLQDACNAWLTSRLETIVDLDGRMNETGEATARGDLHEPRLTSVAKVADIARADKEFMQVAEVYTGRMDFDVGSLVGELVAAESVPALPVQRYKPGGLDKRRAWERTWDLQRLEDAVDALFEVERLKKMAAGKAEEVLRPLVAALRIEEQAKPQVLREAVAAAGYVAEAVKQGLDLTKDIILKPLNDFAKRAKKAGVGDIPVPPKYISADFLSGDYWRLRGKLDVPKERWVSFPNCEGDDGTMVIAWAGYDHLQLARAIAERYELAKENEGRKLVPLLAAIGQQIPWLKQWHNEVDPAFGTRMGDYFESYLAEEAKAIGMSVEQVMAWTPPATAKGRGRKKKVALDAVEAEGDGQ